VIVGISRDQSRIHVLRALMPALASPLLAVGETCPRVRQGSLDDRPGDLMRRSVCRSAACRSAAWHGTRDHRPLEPHFVTLPAVR
jgi:hypothetical protein